MTRTGWYIALVVGVLVIIGALVWFLRPTEQVPVGETPGTEFPVGSDSPTYGSGQPPLALAGQDGATIITRDFIDNGVTIEDPQNTGTYYIAGDIGYCLEDGTCPVAAPTDEYKIVYHANEQTFIVALTKEPLGAARLAAERYLMDTLGISEKAMCQLRAMVMVDSYTNPQFAGMNLGFSFCAGATKLP